MALHCYLIYMTMYNRDIIKQLKIVPDINYQLFTKREREWVSKWISESVGRSVKEQTVQILFFLLSWHYFTYIISRVSLYNIRYHSMIEWYLVVKVLHSIDIIFTIIIIIIVVVDLLLIIIIIIIIILRVSIIWLLHNKTCKGNKPFVLILFIYWYIYIEREREREHSSQNVSCSKCFTTQEISKSIVKMIR